VTDQLTVRIDHLVAGGDGIARDLDGRVVLVAGALPGEEVAVAVTSRGERLIRGTVAAVLEPSPDRIVPPCAHLAEGCGGCDLQHVRAAAQSAMKVAMVTDALRHLGGVADVQVLPGPALAPEAYRTTVRALVDPAGRAGLRRSRSHDAVAIDHCLVAHPLVDEILAQGRFSGAAEVVVRCGAASGDRLVVVTPAPRRRARRVLAGVRVPEGVVVTGADGVALGAADGATQAVLREQVADRWWQVSATSFFQSRPDGAEALVDAVVNAVDRLADSGIGRDATLVDAYAGVGLFAGALRQRGWVGPVVAVEQSPVSVADARVNLADDGVRVVTSAVEKWSGVAAGIVVADPSRRGLGRRAVEVLSATDADGVVLVSCDVAALGRDAALLAGEGFRLERAEVIDLFAHTHHVEVVSTFRR
jgi:23S rRNA (uracil1939-C5)-methyltransferase